MAAPCPCPEKPSTATRRPGSISCPRTVVVHPRADPGSCTPLPPPGRRMCGTGGPGCPDSSTAPRLPCGRRGAFRVSGHDKGPAVPGLLASPRSVGLTPACAGSSLFTAKHMDHPRRGGACIVQCTTHGPPPRVWGATRSTLHSGPATVSGIGPEIVRVNDGPAVDPGERVSEHVTLVDQGCAGLHPLSAAHTCTPPGAASSPYSTGGPAGPAARSGAGGSAPDAARDGRRGGPQSCCP